MKKITLTAIILALSACGTVFSGSEQDVNFDSNIKGVSIYIDGLEACKTPCVYPVGRKSSTSIITAKKKGYEDKQIVLRSGLNTVAILNLTFWPSWLTDLATGGMWQYSRDGVYIDMEKANLQKAELEKVQRDVAIRRFALFNYAELKIAAAGHDNKSEPLQALAELTQTPSDKLIQTINNTHGEVNLAHALTFTPLK